MIRSTCCYNFSLFDLYIRRFELILAGSYHRQVKIYIYKYYSKIISLEASYFVESKSRKNFLEIYIFDCTNEQSSSGCKYYKQKFTQFRGIFFLVLKLYLSNLTILGNGLQSWLLQRACQIARYVNLQFFLPRFLLQFFHTYTTRCI